MPTLERGREREREGEREGERERCANCSFGERGSGGEGGRERARESYADFSFVFEIEGPGFEIESLKGFKIEGVKGVAPLIRAVRVNTTSRRVRVGVEGCVSGSRRRVFEIEGVKGLAPLIKARVCG